MRTFYPYMPNVGPLLDINPLPRVGPFGFNAGPKGSWISIIHENEGFTFVEAVEHRQYCLGLSPRGKRANVNGLRDGSRHNLLRLMEPVVLAS